MSNPQMGQRQSGVGPRLSRGHEGHTKLATWCWVGKVRIKAVDQQCPLDLPALWPVWSSVFPSLCSSELYRCELENARGASRECMVVGTLGFCEAGPAAEQIQVFQLFIHLAKDLPNTCFVPGVMLGAGDTHAVPDLSVKHNPDS